jgi:hypothetical protein
MAVCAGQRLAQVTASDHDYEPPCEARSGWAQRQVVRAGFFYDAVSGHSGGRLMFVGTPWTFARMVSVVDGSGCGDLRLGES